MAALLSISIPTYNRVSFLRKTLKVLMDQIDANALHAEVEIVISDNCSSDATEEYVRSLMALNTHRIVYNRNVQNLGVIKNILKLVEYSSGKYWMFYGDDDIIPGNQLLELVNTFRKHESTNAFMFRYETDEYCGHLANDTSLTPEELAKDFFYYIGNAGIFAVDTASAKEAMQRYTPDLVDTCWPQTMILFMSLYSRPGSKILYKDLVSAETPEVSVIRPNSYYLFETALYALIRTAISIEKQARLPFVELAKHSIDGIKYFKEHKQVIIDDYLYYDSEKQKQDFINAVKKAHREIPAEHRREIDVYHHFVSSWKFIHILKFYRQYVKDSVKRNIQTGFINKLKIYSPYGYYRSITLARRQLAELKQALKREEVSAGSGYF